MLAYKYINCQLAWVALLIGWFWKVLPKHKQSSHSIYYQQTNKKHFISNCFTSKSIPSRQFVTKSQVCGVFWWVMGHATVIKYHNNLTRPVYKKKRDVSSSCSGRASSNQLNNCYFTSASLRKWESTWLAPADLSCSKFSLLGGD